MPRQSRKLSEDDENQRRFGQTDPAALEAVQRISVQVSNGLTAGARRMVDIIEQTELPMASIAAFRALASEGDLKGLLKHNQAMQALARSGAKGASAEDALVALLKDFPEDVARRALEKAYTGFGAAQVEEDDPMDVEEGEAQGIDLETLRGV